MRSLSDTSVRANASRRIKRQTHLLSLVFAIAFLFILVLPSLFRASSPLSTGLEFVTRDYDGLSPGSIPNPKPLPAPETPEPTATPRVVKSKVRAHILMYHYVRTLTAEQAQADAVGNNLSVSPDLLEQHLQSLQELGYQSISMRDAAAGKGTHRSVVLTFDDGYEDFYTTAWPLLKKYNYSATVYIISGKNGNGFLTHEQIKELAASGIEIGAHTTGHMNLASHTPEEQQIDLTASKRALEKLTGTPVTTLAYPAGRYTSDTMRIASDIGFTSAVTTNFGIASIYDSAFELPRLRMSPSMTKERFTSYMR